MKNRKLSTTSKKIILLSVISFWLILYVLIVFLVSVMLRLNLIDIFSLSFFKYNLSFFMVIYSILLLIYHAWAKYLFYKGCIFTSEQGDSWLMKCLKPASVRSGTLVGVHFAYYLREVGAKEWVDKIFNYVITKKCSVGQPIILRSHLLSLPKIKQRLIEKFKNHGLICSVSRECVPRPFSLTLWFSVIFIVSFQWYLPSLSIHETEIIIEPAVLNSIE
ncbi:hypothetical protein EF931_21800 [Salmonella enterica]|nr:hypothetical protein [Salmonella enterica]EJK8997414.1 hypothetical protein [Salmonella enterica]